MKHTASSLAAMPESGVNMALAELMAWSEPNCKNVTFENGCFWVESVGFTAFRIEDYCGSYDAIMPLVFEHRVNLIFAIDEWAAFKHNLLHATYAVHDKKPLRAAACCLILVLQEIKEIEK